MSITVARLIYEVESRTTAAEAGLKRTDAAFNNAGKSSQGFSTSLKQMGATLSSVGSALSIGLTAPLLLIGKKIADIGFDYEKSMNTFQAVTKATADQMSSASKIAEKLGADMTLPATSAGDAAKAMTELAKGGFSAQQAMDAAKGSLQLAAAAQVDEATAATITANALNTFHLAASDSVRVSDLLAAASNASSAEITDVAHALQQAGASAAALKIPMEDLVTAIAEMANAGIKGSDAGTSLKTFMAALAPHTKQAAEAMKQLGIDAFDAQGKFVGLKAVIEQAAPALARMTDEQRTMAIQAAFGSDAMRAANIILGEGVNKWDAMSAAVNQSGAAAELAAAKTKGLSGAWDGFVSQLETVGLQAFKSVNSTLESFIRQAASVVEAIGGLSSSTIKMGVVFAAAAASGGPIALMIGKLAQLDAKGAIVTGVILGAAAMAAAYSTNFGAMQQTLDSFFSRFTSHTQKATSDAGSFSAMMSQIGIGLSYAFDQFLVSIQKIAINVSQLFKLIASAATGHIAELGDIWAKGRYELENIDKSFQERELTRERQFQALQRGGAKGLMDYLAVVNSQGGKGAADAFYTGYSANEPIIKLKSNTQKEVESFMGAIRSSFMKGGSAAGKALYDAAYGETHHSPFFMIHWLEDAAKYANNEAPTEFAKAGSKMGEKLKAGFTSALGNINDFLGRAFGGSGTISESVFDIMLRKFPEVAKELNSQAQSFRETNKAIELYSALMQTASGRNTEFAQKASTAIQKLLDFDKEIRSTITPSIAVLNNSMSETIAVTKEMGEAIAKTVGELVTQTLQAPGAALRRQIELWYSAGKAAAEWGKVMTEGLKKVKEDIRNILGDGIGGALIALAAKFGWHLDKVKGWAGDVVGVIGTLPGKFGDMARGIFSTVQQWAAFADRVLSILHRLDSDIPGSIGGIISKIGGIFKKTQSTAQTGMEGVTNVIKNASEDWAGELEKISNGVGDGISKAMNKAQGAAKTGMAGFIDTIKGGLGFAAGLFGSFMTGLGVANSTGSKTQGAIMGGISGALSGAATGAMWGAAGGPIGAGVGALIGAGVGIIGGLFGGGKSKAQKEAEEQAKIKAGLDMQKLAADIMSSQMEGLKKGLELLEGLKTFSEVPRKAITRFFNEIEDILTLFAEMAKKFKAESIEASKSVAEVMSGAFESLLSGASLINAIKQITPITDQNIEDFINTVFKIFAKWETATDKIQISTAKFTGKIADKLKTSFDFLNIVPDLLKGITENKGFDDSLIDPLFDSVTKIVQKMKALSEAERGMELNRTGATATILGTIFETTKSIVEALSLFSNYKPLEEGAFSPINGDIVRVTNWMDSLVTTTASWGTLADTALANVNNWASSLGKVASAIKIAVGGASSSSGITSSIVRQDGALYARGGSSAPSSATSITLQAPTYVTVQGSVISEGELAKYIDKKVEERLEKARLQMKLASVS